MKKKAILSESGDKYAQIKHSLHTKRVINQYSGFWGKRTTGDLLFHWRKHYYGIWYFGQKWYFKANALLKDLFLTNTHIFISLTDGLEVFVMFLSLVWTLILTAPMYCRGSIGEQVIIIYFSKSDLINKLINILEGLRVCTFWVIYSFMFHHITYYNFCSTEEIKTAVFLFWYNSQQFIWTSADRFLSKTKT